MRHPSHCYDVSCFDYKCKNFVGIWKKEKNILLFLSLSINWLRHCQLFLGRHIFGINNICLICCKMYTVFIFVSCCLNVKGPSNLDKINICNWTQRQGIGSTLVRGYLEGEKTWTLRCTTIRWFIFFISGLIVSSLSQQRLNKNLQREFWKFCTTQWKTSKSRVATCVQI